MRKKKQEYYSWMYQVLYGPPKTEKNNIMIEKSEKFEKYLKPLKIFSFSAGKYDDINEQYQIFLEFDEDLDQLSYSFIYGEYNNPKCSKKREDSYYNDFMKELKDIIKDWDPNKIYFNNTNNYEWHMDIIDDQIQYFGFGDFPDNFEKLQILLEKYFK